LVGEIFNINGPEVVTWNEYFEQFNNVLGLPAMMSEKPGRIRVGMGMVEPIRAIGKYALKHHAPQLLWLSHRSDNLKRLMQQTELTLRCTLNQDELRLFSRDAYYVPGKAERAFGFRPKIGIDEGLEMSAAWLDHMGDAAI
jgi:nucleoside-diphosphate-sugar epimerase